MRRLKESAMHEKESGGGRRGIGVEALRVNMSTTHVSRGPPI
jgi:hypothetical protein